MAARRVKMLFKPVVPMENGTGRSRYLVFLVFLLGAAGLCQPSPGPYANALGQRPRGQLSAEQVVQNLVTMNLRRGEALVAYQSTRVYRLAYRGFPGRRTAEM